MNEPSDDMTDQASDGPCRADYSPEPPRENYLYPAWPQPKNNSGRKAVLLAVGIFAVVFLSFGLMVAAVAKLRLMAGRLAHQNNCKQMVLAVNNIVTNSTTGDIPPAYGRFPASSATSQSFFVSLLPYIEQGNLAANPASPVETYIAAADPNNAGNSSLISYGSNATLLTVGGRPRFPDSFGGRTSGTIVVFERTAKSGATWSNTSSFLIDNNGSSSPEFGEPSSWSSYGTKATALTSAGCIVGMGDGSSRLVNQSSASAGWAWAMDPSINGNSVPSGW